MRTADPQQRILDAALRVFLNVGIQRSTMADIAHAAGMARPSVYKHAGDKSMILTALLQREMAGIVERIRVDEGGRDPEDALIEIVVELVWLARGCPFHRLLTAEPEVVVPPLTTDGRETLAGLQELLKPIVLQVIGPGSLPDRTFDMVTEWVVRLSLSLILTTESATRQRNTRNAVKNFVTEIFVFGDMNVPENRGRCSASESVTETGSALSRALLQTR